MNTPRDAQPPPVVDAKTPVRPTSIRRRRLEMSPRRLFEEMPDTPAGQPPSARMDAEEPVE